MQKRLKAVLLSAFVLPGMGQLYKEQKVKGAIFLILVNIFFLGALALVLRKMGSFLITARIAGVTDAMQTLEEIRKSSPEIAWLLWGLAILWGTSVIDAAFSKPAEEITQPIQNV